VVRFVAAGPRTANAKSMLSSVPLTQIATYQAPARPRPRRSDFFIACAASALIALVFLALDEREIHWFLFPVIACGLLTGADVVAWLRGRADLFDPLTLVACVGYYGFFVAPLLNVYWDRFGLGYDFLIWDDPRTWLGAMAALTAVGLGCFRLAQSWAFRNSSGSKTRWEIQPKRFYPVFAVALALSIVGVISYISAFGGIFNLMKAFELDQEAFVGKGWLLVLAWPLAVLSFITITVALTERKQELQRSLWLGLILMGAVGAAHFVVMGWYGSRSSTIWCLFWMAGIVQTRFRKLPPSFLAASVICLTGFMYLYGFYKDEGREALDVVSSPEIWLQHAQGTHRDLKTMFLGDLSRADNDAYLLHNLTKDPEDYDYRWGLTYLGGFGVLIPRNFWPDRPEFTVEAGTEAQLGRMSVWRSTRVYGLAGEAMLNFGPLGVLPMFAVFGALLGWYRRKLQSWEAMDSRMLIAPFFAVLFILGLVMDSDNIVFVTVTHCPLIFAAIFVSSRRSAANPGSRDGLQLPLKLPRQHGSESIYNS
jgi:hypothetical protein